MKRLFISLLLIFIYISLFAQSVSSSDSAIELPSITTIVNAQTITIVPESIPDFSSVEEPVVESPVEIVEEKPVEIVEQIPTQIEETVTEPDQKKYAVTLIMRTSHPGTLTTHTRFDSMHTKFPFYAGIKQDSLFGKNTRTTLSPYAGLRYDWKYVSIGLDGIYDGQIIGGFDKYVNRGQFDFSLLSYFLDWRINGKIGFAFTNAGVLYPFDLSVFYSKNNFIFFASGGLETRYSNIINLVRNNPEKKTGMSLNTGTLTGEESYWNFRTLLDYRYTDSIRVGLYAEYLYTAFNNGFYVYDYLGTEGVCKKNQWQLNTGFNFVYSIKRFDISLKPVVYWRCAKWCYNFVDIDLNFRCEINDSWTLYWSLDDLKETLTASGGGISFGARYKF
jgi:hypothetical protein